MSNITTPNLGSIITNPGVRKVIYGGYGIATLLYGAILAYFTTVGMTLPGQLIGAGGVLLFLSIPITGLAVANTSGSASAPVESDPTPATGDAQHVAQQDV